MNPVSEADAPEDTRDREPDSGFDPDSNPDPRPGNPEASAAQPKSPESGSIARSSGIMAMGSLVSRATGFLRTAVLGAALGAAVVGDSYQVANTLPNMFYELIGGVLASVVVPLIVNARRDPDGGEAYVQRLLTLATIVLGAATALALLAAPLITSLLIKDGAESGTHGLVTALAYLVLPEILFYGLAALFGAVLNTRGHFGGPMWAPILNNVVVIATAVVFVLLPGPNIPTPSTITTTQVLVLGIGTTLGVALQAMVLLPAMRKVGFRWRWRFDFRNGNFSELGRLASWMLVYVIVSQIGVFTVMALAYRAGQDGGPGPAVYTAANLMFMMAHGVVAVSIITALVPRMSAAAAEEKFSDVTNQVSFGVRLSSVILMPATAAYMALGVPLAIAAFQWGNFTLGQAKSAGVAIVVIGLGLVPFAISQLATFAFYAMRDTKTPALINIPVVAVRLLVDIILYVSLPAKHVVVGLMIGNAVSYLFATVLMIMALRRRLGRLGFTRVAQTLVRLAVASLFAGLVAWALAYSTYDFFGGGKVAGLAALTTGGIGLIVTFAAGAIFMRVSEVSQFADTIKRKFVRSPAA